MRQAVLFSLLISSSAFAAYEQKPLAVSLGGTGTSNRTLLDGSSVQSLDWSARTLKNTSGVSVLNFTSAQNVYNSASPLTTKGDLTISDGTNVVRQAVGTNGQIVMADSSQTNGVRWAAVPTNQFLIDGSISGANVSLGTSTVTSYDSGLLEDAALALTNNTSVGSDSSAQIGCSGANAPTGLTCSSGNESVSISFIPPSNGSIDVCFAGSSFQQANIGSLINAQPVFTIKQTATNAQVTTASGQDKISVGGGGLSIVLLTPFQANQFKVCGLFAVTASVRAMFRLRFVQPAATSGINTLLSDAAGGSAGGRDIHVTARYVVRSSL